MASSRHNMGLAKRGWASNHLMFTRSQSHTAAHNIFAIITYGQTEIPRLNSDNFKLACSQQEGWKHSFNISASTVPKTIWKKIMKGRSACVKASVATGVISDSTRQTNLLDIYIYLYVFIFVFSVYVYILKKELRSFPC